MRSSLFTNEQDKIVQYIKNNSRNKNKMSLNENNNFIIGNWIRPLVATNSQYFLLHYYINHEVKENYLQIKEDGQMAVVDSPDDECSNIEPNVTFSFNNGQLTMSPIIACNFNIK